MGAASYLLLWPMWAWARHPGAVVPFFHRLPMHGLPLQASAKSPEVNETRVQRGLSISRYLLTPAGTSMSPAEPGQGSGNHHQILHLLEMHSPLSKGLVLRTFLQLTETEKSVRERRKSNHFSAADPKLWFPPSEYNKWLLSYLTWS